MVRCCWIWMRTEGGADAAEDTKNERMPFFGPLPFGIAPRAQRQEANGIDQANGLADAVLRATNNAGMERGLTAVLLADPRSAAALEQEFAETRRLRALGAGLHQAGQAHLPRLRG